MAYTETIVERIGLSGGNKIEVYNVSPDAATGNFDVADAAKVKVLGIVPLIEDPTATTDNAIIDALENSTTENQVDFKLWASSFVAATTFRDFRVTLLVTGHTQA